MNTVSSYAQDGNPPLKRCSTCKRELPATSEYFHHHKSNKDGFQYQCKQCRSIAQPREVIPEGYKQCSKCKCILPATVEYFCYRSAYRGRKARLVSHCKQCKAEDDKSYVTRNKNKVKLSKDKYNAEHREQRKIYDAEHKERIDELRRLYTEENKDRISETHRQYCVQYYQTERGRVQMRVSSGNRRARKRNAQGTHTTDELYQQLRRQKNKCYYCHVKLGKERNSWVAEHVIPLSRGGSNSIDNIVIACPTCNLRKHDKLPHEWKDGGRLL